MADILGDDAMWDVVQAALDAHSPVTPAALHVPTIRLSWHNVPRMVGAHVHLHCVPANDLRPHRLDEGCACGPDENEPDYWVHCAFDGREKYDTGRRHRH